MRWLLGLSWETDVLPWMVDSQLLTFIMSCTYFYDLSARRLT